MMIDEHHVEHYQKHGYLLLKQYYDRTMLLDLCYEIHKIICFFLQKNNIDHRKMKRDEMDFNHFDDHLNELAKHKRSEVGLIYDLVKQIPQFIHLSSSKQNSELYQALIKSDSVAWTAQGNGIRIDLPQEEAFLYSWHQDFPYQLRSMDGGVFWSPLCSVTSENGALSIAEGSHQQGVCKLYYDELHQASKRSYKLKIRNVDEIIKTYQTKRVCMDPGDLLVFDFKLLHQSGLNVSAKARWSMQFRYFNILDDFGVATHWQGGYESGRPIEMTMPELFEDA